MTFDSFTIEALVINRSAPLGLAENSVSLIKILDPNTVEFMTAWGHEQLAN